MNVIRAAIAAVIAALSLPMLGVFGQKAAADAGNVTTLSFFEHDTQQTTVDLGARGPGPGDQFIFSGDVFDHAGGTKLGFTTGLCATLSKLLEPIFSVEEDLMLDDLLMNEKSGIYDGGAAMAAYGKMQFTHMDSIEREKISQALLRYCELDTLAMVIILEEFRELIK